MNKVVEIDKKWVTNRDVANAVLSLEAENTSLKELINEVLSIVQRNTSEMTVLKESIQYLTETTEEVRGVVADITGSTDEIKHTKFIGQIPKILPKAREVAETLPGDSVRTLIRRAAKKHPKGIRVGYTNIYDKLCETTGFDVYKIGKVRLNKSDNVDGWRKDPSYINAIFREGYKTDIAVICKQILSE